MPDYYNMELRYHAAFASQSSRRQAVETLACIIPEWIKTSTWMHASTSRISELRCMRRGYCRAMHNSTKIDYRVYECISYKVVDEGIKESTIRV